MSKETKRLREAAFRCPECNRDGLVWPGDLEEETRLTGDEEVSTQVENESFFDDLNPKGKVVIINKRQCAAVIRGPGKIVVACGGVNVVLEGDDEELGKIVCSLSHNLGLGSDGAVTLSLPDKVTVALA